MGTQAWLSGLVPVRLSPYLLVCSSLPSGEFSPEFCRCQVLCQRPGTLKRIEPKHLKEYFTLFIHKKTPMTTQPQFLISQVGKHSDVEEHARSSRLWESRLSHALSVGNTDDASPIWREIQPRCLCVCFLTCCSHFQESISKINWQQ